MLSDWYYPIVAGSELFVQKVAENLVKKNFEVHVITRRNKPLSKHAKINNVNVCRIHYVSKPSWLYFITYYIKSVIKGVKLNKKSGIDVIHGHLAISGGVAGYLLKKILRKPLIITVQGGDLLDYSEGSRFLDPITHLFLRIIMRNADLITAVSRYTKNRARDLGGKNVIIVPNGVEFNEFHAPASKEKIIEDKKFSPAIITTSRLTKKNGIDTIIRAIYDLKEKYPKIGALIIGAGEEESNLKKLTAELGLNDKIIFHGYVKHSELLNHYRNADIFVRPSLNEGFGISFIEAMASGLPAIGTNVGGIIDIITHGKNGFLCKPNDPKCVARYIEKIYSSEKIRSEIIKNGTETAKKYSWELITEKIAKAYKKVIYNLRKY